MAFYNATVCRRDIAMNGSDNLNATDCTVDNATVENDYDILLAWNSEIAYDRIPNSVLLCFYIVLGILGNVAVIVVYHSKMKVKQQNRYFILFLAELDLVAVLLSASYTLFLNFYFILPKGATVCKVFSFVSQATAVTSCFVLLNIAIQRFQLVCRPMKKQLNRRLQKSLLALSVVCGSVLSLPIFAFYGESEIFDMKRNITGYQCGEIKPTKLHGKLFMVYTFILTLSFITVLTTIGVLYIFILKSMRQRSSTIKKRHDNRKKLMELSRENTLDYSTDSTNILESSIMYRTNANSTAMNMFGNGNEKHPRSSWIIVANDNRNDSRNERQTKTSEKTQEKHRKSSVSTIKSHFATHRYSYIFLSITIFFTIAYVPTLAMISISAKEKAFWLNLSYNKLHIFLLLRRMFIVSHIVNPFIYGYFDQSFRRQIKRMLCKICVRFSKRSVETTSSYSQTDTT